VDAAKLDTVRKRLRYQLGLSMDNSDTIASIVASFVALRRTPQTINALYEQYGKLTPEEVQKAAAKYLVEKGRTIVTLTGPGATAPGGAK
jgi:zinc protease